MGWKALHYTFDFVDIMFSKVYILITLDLNIKNGILLTNMMSPVRVIFLYFCKIYGGTSS